MKTKETFEISRLLWARVSTNVAGLYNQRTGYACVFGHYLLQHGANPSKMSGYGNPGAFLSAYGLLDMIAPIVEPYSKNGKTWFKHTQWANEVIAVNDGDKPYVNLSEKEREAKLIELFAQKGCELIFKD